MIDTMGLESPSISEEVVYKVEQFLTKYLGIDVGTGEKKYEFTSGDLLSTHESKIKVKVMRERFLSQYDFDRHTGKTIHRLITVSSDPYLIVEGSVHKAMLGHNVFGGSSDFVLLSCWFINFIESILNVELPYFEVWQVRRIDVAQIFDLGSFEAVEEYIRGMKHAYYPRRKVIPYEFESIYVPGSKTTSKYYHKGPEFAKHDRKRLQKLGKTKIIDDLQKKANNLLRVEIEIKSKKLREVFEGRLPYVGEITMGFLTDSYNKEVFKLLREKQEPDRIEIYRTTESVENRLNDVYSKRLARNLFGTWIKLASIGEKRVKANMSEPTFYKHRKLLMDANIAWLQSDILVNEQYSYVPSGFMPLIHDKHCIGDVDLIVIKELERVAVA
jgi:II/X family phage/plasmid replication protein